MKNTIEKIIRLKKTLRNLSFLISLPAGRQGHFSFQRGFTLMELLVVIVIIGLLATLGVTNYLEARVRARDAQRKANLAQLQSAFELYRADRLTYPPSPLPACGTPLTVAGTTYMQKIPCDPTNSGQHTYRYTTTGSAYNLISCLENENDAQKDAANNAAYCTGSTTNWSYTLTNP
jgi:general secretion pathway protein G